MRIPALTNCGGSEPIADWPENVAAVVRMLLAFTQTRFYKYYWWVFWNESPVDGKEFLSSQYRLSTAAAFELLDNLKERNEPAGFTTQAHHGSVQRFLLTAIQTLAGTKMGTSL